MNQILRFTIIAPLTLLGGCSFQNFLDDGNGLCRAMTGYTNEIDRSIQSEADRQAPNGYATEPYSKANWNSYWNDRIFHLFDIGPSSCEGTYLGISGPEIVAYIIEKRHEEGLVDLQLEERNKAKGL